MKEISVLGVPVTSTTMEELSDIIAEHIKQNKKLTLTAINARKVVRSKENANIDKLLKQFDIHLADGTSIVRQASESIQRITGVDLMSYLIQKADQIQLRIFLYGAKEEVNVQMQKKLKETYPNICIAGYCNGYDDQDVIKKINMSNANIIFIAKGSPTQEQWIIENKERVCTNVFLGVGGGFDIMAGALKRAPKWIQKLGLEWLYRMCQEPRRFLQLPELLKFYIYVKRNKKKKNEVRGKAYEM